MAYAAGLIGPPLFGAVASISSLRAAFAMVITAALAIAVLAILKTDGALEAAAKLGAAPPSHF
jgi:hypothetical protein